MKCATQPFPNPFPTPSSHLIFPPIMNAIIPADIFKTHEGDRHDIIVTLTGYLQYRVSVPVAIASGKALCEEVLPGLEFETLMEDGAEFYNCHDGNYLGKTEPFCTYSFRLTWSDGVDDAAAALKQNPHARIQGSPGFIL